MFSWIKKRLQACGLALARYLNRSKQPVVAGGENWSWCLLPGDVVLVDGRSRVSTAIKYLTQSSWSHAALYVGDLCADGPLLEADLVAGVRAVPVETYASYNVRICRPIGLTDEDKMRVSNFVIARIGNQYDLKNIFDLARYLLPTPPVPVRFRRRLISFGSGDPTKAICSSLIAQAFQSIQYPILPTAWWSSDSPVHRDICYQVKHYSTFTPRDFDLSPYFEVVKPTLLRRFDFREIPWREIDSKLVTASS